MPEPAAIALHDLEFQYGGDGFRLRLDALEVAPGSRVAVIGPSGSGKTTLLRLVAGVVTPRRGRVLTGGVELTALDEAARRAFRVRHVGLVFQDFELLDYLDVLDNILLPCRITPALRLDAGARARARELARHVGLGDKLGDRVHRLSQGEKQRVAVCRALLTAPPLLLADEPTGSLDPGNKHRVLDILCDYARESGATLLTVTHDHELLGRFERVIDFRSLGEAAA